MLPDPLRLGLAYMSRGNILRVRNVRSTKADGQTWLRLHASSGSKPRVTIPAGLLGTLSIGGSFHMPDKALAQRRRLVYNVGNGAASQLPR